MIAYALCGSFCTLDRSLAFLRLLVRDHEVLPIVSEAVYSTDTRFGRAEDLVRTVTELCGRSPLHTIAETEPLGPVLAPELLIVAPCTGNTLAKLAGGITDSAVTMACKSHRRGGRPLLLGLATNDAMAANLKNIGVMSEKKQVYFVPMVQDDPAKKPFSLVCDFDRLPAAFEAARRGEQLRPLFLT